MIKNYLVSYKPSSRNIKTPMIRLTNSMYLFGIAGLVIGDNLAVEYLPGKVVITKINNTNLCSKES